MDCRLNLARTVHSARRGSALVASLIVVTIVAGLSAALVSVHIRAGRQQADGVDTVRSLYMAEAGLAEAFLAVAQGKTGNVGDSDQPARFGNGFFWVEAEERGGGRVQLTSVGLSGTGRIALSEVVARQVNSVASLGFFADERLIVSEGAVVDGVDSSDDDTGGAQKFDMRNPPPPPPETPARLGSNGDVVLYGAPGAGTSITGDVTPGPEGNLTMEAGVEITGSTAPAISQTPLPTIDPPEIASSGSHVHDGTTPMTLSAGRFRYDALRVRAGSQLVVAGPAALVVGTLELQAGAELVLDSSQGNIGLYVTEYLNLPAGSVLSSPAQDCSGVALIVSELASFDRDGDRIPDPPIQLHAGGEFYGQIYAPRNALEIPSSLRIYGAVSARELTLAQGSRMTFDRGMTQQGIVLEALPRLVSWNVTDLPDVPIVRIRVDPRRTLDRLGLTSVPAADAHLEQEIKLEYIDALGTIKTYQGLPSAFDWSDLTATVTVEWIDPGTGTPTSTGDRGLPNVPKITGDGEAFTKKAATTAALEDPSLSSSDLRDFLVAKSPLVKTDLVGAVKRSPQMNSSHLKDVLLANSPLSTEVLAFAVKPTSPLDQSDLGTVLQATSPVDDPTLDTLLDGGSVLGSSDLRDVLISSSPLTPAILSKLSGSSALSTSDKNAVLAAQ